MVAVGLVLAGIFGKGSTISPKMASTAVIDAVSEHDGYTPKNVTCPSDVEETVGTTFDCHFTHDGDSCTAHMRVKSHRHGDLKFDVQVQKDGG